MPSIEVRPIHNDRFARFYQNAEKLSKEDALGQIAQAKVCYVHGTS